MKTIEILIPEDYSHCTVEGGRYFVCDNNSKKKTGVFVTPLPRGTWCMLRQGWVKDDHKYGKSIILRRKSIIDRLTFNWLVKKHIIKDIKNG